MIALSMLLPERLSGIQHLHERVQTRADRPSGGRERRMMLERCAGIEAELRAARTELIIELGEAPQAIAGHSRVSDVERALDSIEAALADIRHRLSH